jgi:trimethylamine--corrinoid protein Co-methyltransferase
MDALKPESQPDARESVSARRRRPSGGRAGRIALREAGTRGMAVHPGMEGGAYQPLSERDIERIHDTALRVLEEIGIGAPIPEILDAALPKGCVLGKDGRLKFPRALVEDVVARMPRELVNYAPNPKYDQEVKGTRVYTTSGGETVSILDYATRSYRPSTLVDLYDAARLVDTLEHIHCFGQPFIACEYSGDVYVHDLNVAYAELAGTEKPIAMATATAAHLDPLLALFDAYVGEEGGFLKRPFCTIGGCPIVSPLRFGKENAEVMVRCARLGLNYDIAVAAQAGATAPAALAGAMVQSFAETLACLVVMNLVRPGTVMNFGMWPFISDLRTGSFTGGSGEEAIITAATVQMANHYGFITSIATGMTDSKLMDAQAGFEKAIGTTAAALAGCNLLCTYPGALGSLIGTSFEGMVIDNDMTGNILRLLRGVEVTDETLSYQVIHDTVFGVGHYLNQEQTLRIMQTEYLYPEVGDRRTPNDWEQSGKEEMYELAHRRVKKILSAHYPQYIDAARDARIRERFPIRLRPEDLRPGNGRW